MQIAQEIAGMVLALHSYHPPLSVQCVSRPHVGTLCRCRNCPLEDDGRVSLQMCLRIDALAAGQRAEQAVESRSFCTGVCDWEKAGICGEYRNYVRDGFCTSGVDRSPGHGVNWPGCATCCAPA